MARRLAVDAEEPDPRIVREAAEVIRRGGLVVIPTDTAYGLAGDAADPDVVRRVLEVKGRRGKAGMPVLAASIEQVEEVAVLSGAARSLAKAFWPGGLTLIVRARHPFPEEVQGPGGTLAVRVPGHLVARMVIRQVGFPVTGTSANRSGEPSPRSAEEVIAQIGERVDLVLDAGPTSYTADSTIMDCTVEPLRVVRWGAVDEEALRPWLAPPEP